MLRNKIVHFKKIYKFDFDHFLIKCIVFGLVVITIKDRTFNLYLIKIDKPLLNFWTEKCFQTRAKGSLQRVIGHWTLQMCVYRFEKWTKEMIFFECSKYRSNAAVTSFRKVHFLQYNFTFL